MQEFIKNNKVFSIFVVVFICINLVFMLAFFQNKDDSNPQPKPDPTPETGGDDKDEDKEEVKTPSISKFYATFNNDSVNFSFELDLYDETLKELALYQDGVKLADVTGHTNYSLPVLVYNFSTGLNTFELKATLNNGDVLSKNVNVKIDYAFDLDFESTKVEGGYNFAITYRYDAITPVTTPTIYISNLDSNLIKVDFIGTEVLSEDRYILAKTTYFFDDELLSDGYYNFMVRFNFENVSQSVRYPVSVVKGV